MKQLGEKKTNLKHYEKHQLNKWNSQKKIIFQSDWGEKKNNTRKRLIEKYFYMTKKYTWKTESTVVIPAVVIKLNNNLSKCILSYLRTTTWHAELNICSFLYCHNWKGKIINKNWHFCLFPYIFLFLSLSSFSITKM